MGHSLTSGIRWLKFDAVETIPWDGCIDDANIFYICSKFGQFIGVVAYPYYMISLGLLKEKYNFGDQMPMELHFF